MIRYRLLSPFLILTCAGFLLFSSLANAQTTTPPPPPATQEPPAQGPIDPKDPKFQDEFKKLQQENPAIAAEIQRLIQMGDINKATAVYKKYKEEKAGKDKEKLLMEQEEKEAEETPLGGKKVGTKDELTPEALKEKKRERMSDLEKILSGQIPQEVSLELEQFGYDTFLRTVSTFIPGDSLPVGPDYSIGPEDEFTLTLWGMVEGIYKLKVSREGTVTLPKVGVTPVAGVRFGDLERHIKQKLSQYYRDFNLSVSMGSLRTMQIYVVGEVNHPGSYSLGSLATAFNALFAAGGPTKKGSLRNIRLIRGGKTIKTIDLYLFLMRGDKTQDLRLQPEDTILVPLIGPVVGVAGNVYRPAIYEMKGDTTLKDALALAGGTLPTGFLSQVQVERIESNQKKVVADLDLRPDGKENGQWALSIRNMDLIKVLPISDRTENIVYLTGHVKRPGGYELKAEMRLLDLFPKGYEDLLPDSYLEYGEITRVKEPDLHPETIPFHVGKLLSGDPSQNISLLRFDRVTLFSKEQIREVPSVEVTGAVQR
ncbi:MAG: SLBB domain-containing protein, partial [Nitrospirae bacterium]|nr:SLBB domain-containing protein [Nitrospirota bacterium]